MVQQRWQQVVLWTAFNAGHDNRDQGQPLLCAGGMSPPLRAALSPHSDQGHLARIAISATGLCWCGQ